ncbi:529_t:CDS:2 [Paraglomus occultum]|uniref:529_t:CDS:1 n=1 Tax=Paraglomus occultum TaxID=144539 RepID=A0A9N8ZIL7_9GLOM|nr:529_t:CDS:2 [Paraglomus occultum]
MTTPRKVAIIGSGVSGLGAAWLLSEHSPHHVTLYESGSYLGGHTHTVDYTPPNSKTSIPVDTGFIVFNPLTYPNLLRFFNHKEIDYMPSNMSLSVSRNRGDFEWSGQNLLTLFCQWENLLSLDMWRTIFDICKFNWRATDLINTSEDDEERRMNLGEWLDKHGYSQAFKDNYLLPMTAAIWSTPIDKCSMDFPVLTLIQFMHNHRLLQVVDRVQWLTVKNGSRMYVDAITSKIDSIRLNTKITSITRTSTSDGVQITVNDNNNVGETYDYVILATHADQALEILGSEATENEKRILGNFQFSKNKAVLHSDLELMPTRRSAFSAWNYITKSDENTRNISQVSLTYSMNILQSISEETHGPVLVSLNSIYEPSPSKTFASWDYEHPLITPAAIAAQSELHEIQNLPGLHTLYCGAWTKYGFHEDGFTSGLRAAVMLGAVPPFAIADATYVGGKRVELTKAWATAKVLWIIFEWTVYFVGYLIFCVHAFLCVVYEEGGVYVKRGLEYVEKEYGRTSTKKDE